MIRSILVVDEYDTHRVALANTLAKTTGADVRTAGSGSAALTAMHERRWDVAVLDLDMPDMTGLQLIDALAQAPGAEGIVITSTHQPRIVQAASAYASSRGISTLATLEKPLRAGRVRAVAATLEKALIDDRAARSSDLVDAPLLNVSEYELRSALASGQIEGFLQPQHYTATGALRGAEILARWRRADGSVLPPAMFLPAFQEAGLMRPFTDHMIRQAFAVQARLHWLRNFVISVNVPAGVASSTGWAQELAEDAWRANADPTRLVVEITEDGGAAAIPALTGAVTQLRLRGFSCSIDDFGTGDSSLDRLLWVPFDELKIDRHLISHARQHPHARRILSSTIDMARGLGIVVVVEGVESEQDLKLITSLGGQVTQGYLHSQPMSLEAFVAYAAACAAQPRHGASTALYHSLLS